MSHAKQLRTRRSLDAYVASIHRPGPPGNGKVEVGQHGQEMVSATV